MPELKTNKPNIPASNRWISYRSEIKVVDCTIRDGGLMNNHRFDDEVVRAVYQACNDAGIDYMEIGYKADKKQFSEEEYGSWKFCNEEAIKNIVKENNGITKISVMADAERTDFHNDIIPKDESIIDMIRVATYIYQIPTALDIIEDAFNKGYETTVNLMAVSTVKEDELNEALNLLAKSKVFAIYLVDSYGALYSEQVHYLMRKYLHYAEAHGKQIGMHAHNNQQLAFANTIEAIIMGANMVDGSLAGLGRGAGNCPTEALLGFLHNPKYHMRPLLHCIQKYIEPMRAELKWGFDVPYLITGIMNQHPRAAIKFNNSNDHGDLVKFFDMMANEE
jgi:4-hydroxy 2-oxovalerate aldolase